MSSNDNHAGSDNQATPAGTVVSQGWIGFLTQFGPPLAVIAAPFIYFGWAVGVYRAQSLGIASEVLAASPREAAAITGMNYLSMPVIVLGLAALAALWLHPRILMLPRQYLLRLAASLIFLGIALFCLAPLGFTEYAHLLDKYTPGLMALGVASVAYGLALRKRSAPDAFRNPITTAQKAITGALIAVMLVWQALVLAQVAGTSYARELLTYGRAPQVTVFSDKSLNIDIPNVAKSELRNGSRYKIRYKGLILLERTKSTYYLTGRGSRYPVATIVSLPVGDKGIRLEFVSKIG